MLSARCPRPSIDMMPVRACRSFRSQLPLGGDTSGLMPKAGPGPRRPNGALLALPWSDVDFDAGTVTVRRTLIMVGEEFILKEPKTKASRRTISVPVFAMDALHEHRKKMLARGFADKA